jgi:glycopeptide antibiotics resistance protein
MEYNPNIFTSYEGPRDAVDGGFAPKINHKLLKQYGKFERKIVTTGRRDQHSALAVFLVASILETKKKRLRKKAKGLDDVVRVSLSLSLSLSCMQLFIHIIAYM